MNYLTAIEKRCSRRNYLPSPIAKEKVEQIEAKIKELNKISGLSIKFIKDAEDAFNSFKKSYGLLKGVKSVILLKGDKCDSNLKEKAGYYGEMLVLEATLLDLGTCWVGGSYDKKSKLFSVLPDEEMACVITIGNVNQEKNFREKLIYSLTHRKRIKIEDLYSADKMPPKWFIEGIESVQKAPTAVNSMKFRFHYFYDSVSINIPCNSNYDMVDLGIGKLHFELAAKGKFELGNKAKFNKE